MQNFLFPHPDSIRRVTVAMAGFVFSALTLSPQAAEPQSPLPFSPLSSVLAAESSGSLPFSLGERLTYRVSVSKIGSVGRGSMWIEGPVDVRGISTWLLRFDFSAGFGPMKAVDRTSSWLDPRRMSAQRFSKHEKHVLAHHDERVEIFSADRRWSAADGGNGASPTDAPLDELSFMYFIRTLPLELDSTYRFDRHFDAARSPTTVKAIRREVVSTSVGRFETILVEMRVRDPRRYHGEGVIRINLSDDTMRIPVRIESAMPVIGTAVMTLDGYEDPGRRKLAKL
jgi:hypothetical protein